MTRRVECYFKNPDTGEEGWDIQFITMKGKSKRDIAEKIKKLPNFDCFIEFDFDEFNT
jgi:glycerate kinase